MKRTGGGWGWGGPRRRDQGGGPPCPCCRTFGSRAWPRCCRSLAGRPLWEAVREWGHSCGARCPARCAVRRPAPARRHRVDRSPRNRHQTHTDELVGRSATRSGRVPSSQTVASVAIPFRLSFLSLSFSFSFLLECRFLVWCQTVHAKGRAPFFSRVLSFTDRLAKRVCEENMRNGKKEREKREKSPKSAPARNACRLLSAGVWRRRKRGKKTNDLRGCTRRQNHNDTRLLSSPLPSLIVVHSVFLSVMCSFRVQNEAHFFFENRNIGSRRASFAPAQSPTRFLFLFLAGRRHGRRVCFALLTFRRAYGAYTV